MKNSIRNAFAFCFLIGYAYAMEHQHYSIKEDMGEESSKNELDNLVRQAGEGRSGDKVKSLRELSAEDARKIANFLYLRLGGKASFGQAEYSGFNDSLSRISEPSRYQILKNLLGSDRFIWAIRYVPRDINVYRGSDFVMKSGDEASSHDEFYVGTGLLAARYRSPNGKLVVLIAEDGNDRVAKIVNVADKRVIGIVGRGRQSSYKSDDMRVKFQDSQFIIEMRLPVHDLQQYLFIKLLDAVDLVNGSLNAMDKYVQQAWNHYSVEDQEKIYRAYGSLRALKTLFTQESIASEQPALKESKDTVKADLKMNEDERDPASIRQKLMNNISTQLQRYERAKKLKDVGYIAQQECIRNIEEIILSEDSLGLLYQGDSDYSQFINGFAISTDIKNQMAVDFLKDQPLSQVFELNPTFEKSLFLRLLIAARDAGVEAPAWQGGWGRTIMDTLTPEQKTEIKKYFLKPPKAFLERRPKWLSNK